MDEKKPVTLYALSTCMWCKKTRALLDEEGIDYNCIYVNELEGDERAKALNEITEHNSSRSFPTLVIGEEVIIGFKPDEIKEACKKIKGE